MSDPFNEKGCIAGTILIVIIAILLLLLAGYGAYRLFIATAGSGVIQFINAAR